MTPQRPGSLYTADDRADKQISATGASLKDWSPDSWQSREALQQPNYEDQEELAAALDEIHNRPPLVFAGEARNLQAQLANAAAGNAFVLFGGDCAESFAEFRADNVRDTYRVLLQMSVVLMYGAGVPVVKLGRMAGQFAKPRSEDLETIGGVSLPSYRGDNINGSDFTPEARRPDPNRLLKAYDQSCSTLNLLRAFSQGGYAAMQRVSKWNLDFMEDSERGAEYRKLAANVDAAINFMNACGIDEDNPAMKSTDFFTAHEALHLGYEEKLTRLDSTTEEYYGCSAHFLWCGERTRQPEGAHMEYFRGISNPIGIKISDKSDGDSVVSLVKSLNPENVPGRITLISRMGAEKLREHLPRLIQAIQDAGLNVLWVADPMHGNTIKTDNGYKTRPFERIREEVMVRLAWSTKGKGDAELGSRGTRRERRFHERVAFLSEQAVHTYATGFFPLERSFRFLFCSFLFFFVDSIEPVCGYGEFARTLPDGVLRRARADGHAPRRRPPRDDWAERDGVHGRHRGGDHRRLGAALPDPLRPPPQRLSGARARVPHVLGAGQDAGAWRRRRQLSRARSLGRSAAAAVVKSRGAKLAGR